MCIIISFVGFSAFAVVLLFDLWLKKLNIGDLDSLSVFGSMRQK